MRLSSLRIFVQIFCLLGFLVIFLLTEYRGQDSLQYPVSLLFRIDPLAALAAALAPGAFSLGLLWPALVVIALTFILGRFFCGWICPLGTTLDGMGRLVGRGRGRNVKPSWRRLKYLLLAALTAAGLFGLQLFGLFDPLSIFLRTLTLSLYPAFDLMMNAVFDFFYQHDVPLLSSLVNGSYDFFRQYVLAFHPPVFTLGLLTLAVFILLIVLEKVERRFWCKNLCPLGALLGLCSRYALLQREPSATCSGCASCLQNCRSGVDNDGRRHPDECLVCLDCGGFCPQEKVRFQWGTPRPSAGVDLPRRDLMVAVATGVLVAPVARAAPAPADRRSYLLRPPGALAEDEFLRRCIRCGECMKVCIGGALHPALLEAGAVGLWTPRLVPRIGYCEYNCTLCGQVCPTGALKLLPLEEKRKFVLGIAVFDQDRCLPFARREECLVCEEHCPTPQKAIVFEEKKVQTAEGVRTLKIPRVVADRCIGCGICETRCPVEGASAIRITNEGETRRERDPWS